jgi:hypothetical protein
VATKPKPGATKSKPDATKTKPDATKSKPGATKSKCSAAWIHATDFRHFNGLWPIPNDRAQPPFSVPTSRPQGSVVERGPAKTIAQISDFRKENVGRFKTANFQIFPASRLPPRLTLG